MKIAIGCDHIVTEIKNEVVQLLKKKGIEVLDCGTYDHARTHYPIYGKRVGEKVALKEADYGIDISGTGIGISNAANKIHGVRCVLARDPKTVKAARKKLDANVLAFGGRVVGMGVIEEMIDAFLETEFAPTAENCRLKQALNAMIPNDPALNQENLFDDLLARWERGEYHD